MQTTGPSEKFYARSHENWLQAEDSAVTFVEEAEISPGDRYYPVYDFLRSHQGEFSVFEVGYGGPQYFKIYSKYAKTYLGIDIVDRSLGMNRFDNVELVHRDLDHDWDIDQKFDLIVALMIFEHLFDPFHSFEQLHKVMHDRSVAIVNLPLITGIKNRMRVLRGRLPVTSSLDWWDKREWDGNHLHYFTLESIERIAGLNALRVDRVVPVGGRLGLKKRFPTLLCDEISVFLTKQA